MDSKKRVYIASWMPKGVRFGLGVYELDNNTGALVSVQNLEYGQTINMMTSDSERQLLYAVDGATGPQGQSAGGGNVFVYSISSETGKPIKIQEKETLASNPFYIAIDKKKKFAVVAHHGGKSAVTHITKKENGSYQREIIYDDSVVELFQLNDDGTLGDLCDVRYHTGSGPTERQLTAHPHCVEFSPDGKWIACCDKGSDKVYIYRINPDTSSLESIGEPFQCEAGFMPRYCVFHPKLPYLILNGEGSTSLCVLQVSEEGQLSLNGYFSSEPIGYVREDQVYEGQGLCISPSGQYVYSAVRGLDSIVCFRILNNGKLNLLQRYNVEGIWPRGLGISSDGNWLVATLYQNGTVISLKIMENGTLEPGKAFQFQEYASNVLISGIQ